MLLKKFFLIFLKYFFVLKTLYGIGIMFLKYSTYKNNKYVSNYPWFVIITDLLFILFWLYLVVRSDVATSSEKIERWIFDNQGYKIGPLFTTVLYLALMLAFYYMGDNISLVYFYGTIFFAFIWFCWRKLREKSRRIYKKINK